MTIALTAGNYNAVVDPAQGGAILSADWRSPAGMNVAVLEPMNETLAPFKAGCFAMVPFANRIADGRFRFEGGRLRSAGQSPRRGDGDPWFRA
jgi:aldose 1-epimerase